MNWYKLLKIAQLWDTPDLDDRSDFSGDIYRFYKFEYQLSSITNYNFSGHPRRKENIIRQLQEHLKGSIVKIIPVIIHVFAKWLRYHAILNPNEWARSRVEEEVRRIDEDGSGDLIGNAFSEYSWLRAKQDGTKLVDDVGIRNNKYNWELLRYISSNLNQYPSFKQLRDLLAEDFKESWLEDYQEEWTKEGKNIEQELENMKKNISLDKILDVQDTISLAPTLREFDLEESAAQEILVNNVFPVWFAEWQPKGIEQTRKRVEDVYKLLQNTSNNINDIGNAIAIISIALNTIHQSGSMLEHFENPDYLPEDVYVESDLSQEFLLLSSGNYLEEWNKQLREIGVEV